MLGILPKALWAAAPRRGRGGRGALVPRELGVGRAPADRCRRRDEPARPGPSRSRRRSRGPGSRSTGSHRRVASATVLGPLLAGPAERARPASPASRSSPGWPTPMRASSAPACSSRATRSTPAGRAAASPSIPTDAVAIPGVYRAAAPIAGRWFLGGAMNATGKALDWLRDDVLRSPAPTGDLLAEAAAVAPGADGLVFLPYLAGERSPIWDAVGARRLRRADPPPRPGAPRPGGRSRPPISPSVTSPRRSSPPASRSASCGSPAGSRRESRRSTSSRPTSPASRSRSRRSSRPPWSARRSWPAIGIGAFADLADGVRAVVRIDRPDEPDPARRRGLRRLYATYVDLYPALRPSFRRLAALDPDAPADDEPRARSARRRPARRSAELVAARGAGARSGPAGRPARRRHDRRRRDRRWWLHRPVDGVLQSPSTTRRRESSSSSRPSAAAAPSGRNGGFVTAWWDELPDLVADFGVDAALELARVSATTSRRSGRGPSEHDIDAWYRRSGYVIASAPPAQDERSTTSPRRAPGSASAPESSP